MYIKFLFVQKINGILNISLARVFFQVSFLAHKIKLKQNDFFFERKIVCELKSIGRV